MVKKILKACLNNINDMKNNGYNPPVVDDEILFLERDDTTTLLDSQPAMLRPHAPGGTVRLGAGRGAA